MRKLLLLVVTLASGCAVTPMQLREEGANQTYVMKMPPAEAAACVARNIEESGRDSLIGRFQTSVRPGRVQGQTELLAVTLEFTHLVADFEPTSSGSRANVWVSTKLLDSLQQRLAKSFEGC